MSLQSLIEYTSNKAKEGLQGVELWVNDAEHGVFPGEEPWNLADIRKKLDAAKNAVEDLYVVVTAVPPAPDEFTIIDGHEV